MYTPSTRSLLLRAIAAACSEHIQGTFREHSGNIQGTFREHSGNIQCIIVASDHGNSIIAAACKLLGVQINLFGRHKHVYDYYLVSQPIEHYGVRRLSYWPRVFELICPDIRVSVD